MSRTLNLVAQVLDRGRKLHKLGAEREALRAFDQLSRFRHLEPEVAEEVQSRLAEILVKHGKFHRARRHLAAALAHQPTNPHYHHLMATAIEADLEGEPAQALEHWRQALKHDPTQPQYLSAFGLLAVREGQNEEGLTALRQALALAADDPAVLDRVMEGLCLADCCEEARSAVRAALFRNPRSLPIRQLWDDFQFNQLRAQQQAAGRRHLSFSSNEEPAVLPFRRPPAGTVTLGTRILGRDRAARRLPPHQGTWIPDKKHA
jgi:tetratricopeptide (TPR) repeat protein